MKLLDRLQSILLFCAGFSLHFENISLGGSTAGARTFTFAFFILIAYILLAFFRVHRKWFTIVQNAKFYRPLLLFFILLVMMNAIYKIPSSNAQIVPISTLSCIVFYIVMLLDFHENPNRAPIALYGMAFGAMFLWVCFLLGIGLEDSERLSMFGANQNELGLKCCISGSIIIYDFIVNDKLRLGISRFLFAIPMVGIVQMLFLSGSRVSLASLALVFIVCVFYYPTQSKLTKFVVLIVGVVVAVFAIRYILTLDLLVSRVMDTVENGETANRTDIWAIVLEKSLEHPIFGVGSTGYSEWMVLLGKGFSPHNVLIEVFAYTGIVGLVFMIVFWWRVVYADIFCLRHKVLFPILLFFPIAGVILSGQVLHAKFAYIIYAYSITQYYQISNKSI